MKKRLFFLIALLLILAGFLNWRVKIKNLWQDLAKEKLPAPIEFLTEQKTINNTLTTSANENKITGQIPTSINLKVPFTSQAPLGNWDEIFKEACEETAALMVDYYYQGKNFTPQIATDEILKMVNWQIKNWGGHFDLTAEQTAKLIKEYFGYSKVEIIDNPTIEYIKKEVNSGRPVIVPAAGRLLGNPYFRNPGPLYHMVVIKGYAKDKFITNDPGTKRGKDYLYNYQTIMQAMHDWNPEDITLGAKKIIVIYPN